MSKLRTANANLRYQGTLALALLAGGLGAGCGGGNDHTITIDPEGYDGIGEETFNRRAVWPGDGQLPGRGPGYLVIY